MLRGTWINSFVHYTRFPDFIFGVFHWVASLLRVPLLSVDAAPLKGKAVEGYIESLVG